MTLATNILIMTRMRTKIILTEEKS